LSDEELAAYLRRCSEHHAEMIYQHMRFTGAAMLPTGDLLAHLGDWTGLPYAELLGMMRGASPVSAGASAEFERLITTIPQDHSARELVESDGEPGEVLERLRSLEGDTGTAVSEYLDLVGCRLLDGFDISGRYALELPEALVRAIRAAVGGGEVEPTDVEEKIAEVRRQVPDEHRAQFNELLEEARLMYRLRDERGVFSDIWAAGIMRRAALAGGRRLAAKDRIQDPEHFIDAGLEEMCSLVSGGDGPTADELAQRFDYRMSHSAKDVPDILGEPPAPPPDPSGLPPAPGRVMRAIGIAIESLFGSSEEEHEENLLRGLAASGGVYEGPARRSGGLLSHSAIVAREYGIPGVVGTREATDRIPDGARVRVDGDAGEVSVYR
jgi:pyruvate,water dikinase